MRITNRLVNRENPRSFRGRGGSLLMRTPGGKIADLSTLTISRAFRPSPTPDSEDAVSIVGGEYSLYSGGVWSELLPAISYAVEDGAPGASESWERLTGATNYTDFISANTPDPQWTILPRSAQPLAPSWKSNAFKFGTTSVRWPTE